MTAELSAAGLRRNFHTRRRVSSGEVVCKREGRRMYEYARAGWFLVIDLGFPFSC